MPSWFSKPDGPQYRIFFATDVHGSEPTFRKFINAAKAYGVDALILGGDISGKMLIPIIDLGRGKYTATLQGNTISMSTDELTAFEKKLAALGFYFGVMDQPQYDRCVQDASEVDRLFLEKAGERLTGWIRLAEERLAGTGITPVFPLWQQPTPELARLMIGSGLRARITCVDPRAIPPSFAGREFDADLLGDLPPHVDPCGERGEFHTFAYDGPMFAKRIPIECGVTVERDGFVFTDLLAAAPGRTVRGAGSSWPASSPWR